MAMWQRAYRCCAAVRSLIAPPGARRGYPIISPSWPEACETAGANRRGIDPVGRRLADRRTNRGALVRGGAEPAQRPAAAAPRAFRGRREALSQSPDASPRSRRPSSGNCAPPSASPGSAATRAATPKPATFSRRSTAGSPRVSTRKTSGREGTARRAELGWTAHAGISSLLARQASARPGIARDSRQSDTRNWRSLFTRQRQAYRSRLAGSDAQPAGQRPCHEYNIR